MYEQRADANLVGVQSAFDRFINAPPDDRQSAFADFSGVVFDYFSHRVESDAGRSLFSLDVPDRIQRFAAAWLLRAMTNSATAVPRQLYLPVGVNQFCRFTSLAWPRCWAALVR